MNMLPPAIALFSAILKKEGHQVKVFDTTYYAVDHGIDSDGSKEQGLNVVPYQKEMEKKGLRIKDSSWKDDVSKLVNDYHPDILILSSTEDMWELGMRILEEIKEYKNKYKIPVLAGGVFPTFAPEICIKYDLIDMVCVGEGENALVDICKKIEHKKDYSKVTNLWIKQDDNTIQKNSITKPVDINENPIIDTSLFEEARLYRPMAGKVYKMYPVETIRGCPYTCKFCNSPDQMRLYKGLGHNFFRKKRMDLVYKELKYFKEVHKVEYNYFWADTFLAMNKKELDEFCEMYKEIMLPFWMQTRPETINDHNIKKLSEVGLHRISFGVEHGNEEFRAKILDRRWKNKDIIERLKIPHKYGVAFSVNNITGFPTETKKLAFDTIELNRQFNSDNTSCSILVPFHGTELHDLCVKKGYLDPNVICAVSNSGESLLNMPQWDKKDITRLRDVFAMYIKFPKNRWPEIKEAETNIELREDLRSEFIKTYWSDANAKIEDDIAEAAKGLF